MAAAAGGRGALSVERVSAQDTLALRQQVLRPHQRRDQTVLPGDDVPGALHLAARQDGAIVAIGSISPDPHPHDPRDGDWRVRGMAAAPEARGRGHGSAILAGLIAHATQNGARRVWCNARTPARSLYDRAGFVVEGEQFEIDPIGPHLLMVLTTPGGAGGLPLTAATPR